jgi:hypothetical protein
MRSRLALTVASALALAVPALAAGQTETYTYGDDQFRGSLTLNGPFSLDGCGLYVCLTLEAGHVRPDTPRDRFLEPVYGPYAVYARGLTAALTPAGRDLLAQLSAEYGAPVHFGWEVPYQAGYSSCSRWIPGQLPRVCDSDFGLGFVSGNVASGADFRSTTQEMGVHMGQASGQYWMRLSSVTYLWAYAPQRSVLVDRFAPAVVVTPEPSAFALTAAGVAALAGLARRRARDLGRRRSRFRLRDE